MGKYNRMTERTGVITVVRALAAVCLLLAAGCASGDGLVKGEEVSYKLNTFSFDQKNAPYDILTEYHIAPGDQLDVLFQTRTWEKRENFRLGIDNQVIIKFIHAPDLTVDEKVRPDGTVTLPYMGTYTINGKTVEEVTAEMKAYYSKILVSPEIYILVPEYRSAINALKTDLHTASRGLSRLVTVQPDGYVTFPLIGRIFVSGRTMNDVNAELNKLYDQLMAGLNCDLFLEHHSGSKLYVLGDVQKPGVYEMPKPLTVEQVIAMAGGFNYGARLDSIIIARKKANKMIATRIDLAQPLSSGDSYRFFYLSPDDIVYVPKRPITRAAELMRDLSQMITWTGWGLGFGWQLNNAPNGTIKF